MGKVSVVGAGMKSHPGVAAKTFTVLGEAEVNIEMISTSPIKISCVVREEHVETAVKQLTPPSGSVRTPCSPRTSRASIARRWPSRSRCGGGRHRAVGATMLEVLAERSFPADEVVPFASERSAGRTLPWGGSD